MRFKMAITLPPAESSFRRRQFPRGRTRAVPVPLRAVLRLLPLPCAGFSSSFFSFFLQCRPHGRAPLNPQCHGQQNPGGAPLNPPHGGVAPDPPNWCGLSPPEGDHPLNPLRRSQSCLKSWWRGGPPHLSFELFEMPQHQKDRAWYDIVTFDEYWFYFTTDHEHIWLSEGTEALEGASDFSISSGCPGISHGDGAVLVFSLAPTAEVRLVNAVAMDPRVVAAFSMNGTQLFVQVWCPRDLTQDDQKFELKPIGALLIEIHRNSKLIHHPKTVPIRHSQIEILSSLMIR
jgi:hypothetical protein